MTNNLPSLLVALVNHTAIVKVNGRANFTSSVVFKRLISELRERGFHSFVLDLSDCITMDSTFLGVLASTALKLADANNSRPSGAHCVPVDSPTLRLLNPNQRITDLLDNLGVSDLFRTVQCESEPAGAQFRTPAEDFQPSREEISRTCLEAHQLLMDINPQNVPKFKDVTQFLAEDLKKMSTE